MKILNILMLIPAFLLASCGRDQEISEERARGKVDFYNEITAVFDQVQDLPSAKKAAEKMKDLLAGLEEAHAIQEKVTLDAEETQEVNTITDGAVEKMGASIENAEKRLSNDADAAAVLESAIDSLYQTLEKLEES